MLKRSVRPLLTLVVALVVTGTMSTLCSARELKSPVGPQAAHAMTSSRPAPPATLGEPDQPLSPPPVHLSNGVEALPPGEPAEDGSIDWMVWWTSWIWANWLARAAL